MLIMGTEKAHSIRVYRAQSVGGLRQPISGSCDGPDRGHRIWVKQQDSKINQGDASESAQTMMLHSLHKEALQILCNAVQANNMK